MTDHSSPKRRRSSRLDLPISIYRDELIKVVDESQVVVIVGETGSGKTTQLPQYLHQDGLEGNGIIAVTQPRRVAAISVAHRVAEELECLVGELVGYQVRFESCLSEETKIKYMTDGCLLREFLVDPHLNKYSIVVLDEAHERSLDTDILFGLVKKMLEKNNAKSKSRCPKIVVMSATLDYNKFSRFFNDCPIFNIPGRLFPVENIYCDLIGPKELADPNYAPKVVEAVMDIHVDYPLGDVLVFLTGQAEIETACDILFEKAERVDYEHDVRHKNVRALLILPIYGAMPTDQQRAVFEPAGRGVRKVIVATNIAGTSLTIDGIRYVVDSGFVKQLSYNPRTGLDALTVVPISRSEATQRSGRAGRTAPGKCFRLYTEQVYNECMDENTVPEIQRTNLTSVVLSLKCLGVHDVLRFSYIDPPEERMLLEALRQLYIFEALNKNGEVTMLGQQMVEFPLPPGLARALIRSVQLDCVEAMLPIAAMLSVENVFVRSGARQQSELVEKAHRKLATQAGGSNDFATLLCIYQKCHQSDNPKKWCSVHFIQWRALKMAVKVKEQLSGILSRINVSLSRRSKTVDSLSERTRQAICAGCFCNAARKSQKGLGFRSMDGHGSVLHIHPSSALFGMEDKLDWIVFHEVVWTTRIYARTVCPVRYEWLKDLLPRLHVVDVHMLSSSGEVDRNIEEKPTAVTVSEEENPTIPADEEDALSKLSRRNDESSVAAAKMRYLQRKKEKT